MPSLYRCLAHLWVIYWDFSLIHSTFPRTLPPVNIEHFCTGIYSNSWMGNGQQNVQGIWLVCMNQGCAINSEHIFILLELFQCIKAVLWWMKLFSERVQCPSCGRWAAFKTGSGSRRPLRRRSQTCRCIWLGTRHPWSQDHGLRIKKGYKWIKPLETLETPNPLETPIRNASSVKNTPFL